jgi:hypothetical protein
MHQENDADGTSADFHTSSDDLRLTGEEKIVEPLSPDDHIRMHDAGARRKREALLTGAGLAILFIIAVGCFGVFIFNTESEKIRIAAQLMTMIVTAVVGFLYSRNSSRSN